MKINEKKDEKIFYSPSYENYQKSNLNNLNILIKYIINKKIPNYSNKFYIKNKFSNSSKEIEISKIKLKNSYLTTKFTKHNFPTKQTNHIFTFN